MLSRSRRWAALLGITASCLVLLFCLLLLVVVPTDQALELYLFDTYFIVAHFHYTYLSVFLLGLPAAVFLAVALRRGWHRGGASRDGTA